MSKGVYSKTGEYHNRRSIRLRGYDYSKPGAYFVTICIRQWTKPLFGNVVDGTVVLNEYGHIVHDGWNNLTDHYNNIRLDEFIVMPNHIHGIIIIRNSVGAGSSGPVNERSGHHGRERKGRDNRAPTLGNMVAYFKYQTTKKINSVRQSRIQKIWQRNYFDHIIRDDKSIYFIRKYIRNNPAKWSINLKHFMMEKELGDIFKHIEKHDASA